MKIFTKMPDFHGWKDRTCIDFTVAVNTANGDIKGKRDTNHFDRITYKHHGNHETYRLLVRETQNGIPGREESNCRYNLTIDGSFHKNHFNGENYQRFTYDGLQSELDKFERDLQLPLDRCAIQNLEIGVNVPVPFVVKEFLNNSLLLHKTTSFENYTPDKNGFSLGRWAVHNQYSIKCYDKGTQFGLTDPLMRFEVRFIKMERLKRYGIRNLQDLRDRNKVFKSGEILIKAWENVLVYEPTFNINNCTLSPEYTNLLDKGRYRDYWTKLNSDNPREFTRNRNKIKELMRLYSPTDTHKLIRELIWKEWIETMGVGGIDCLP